MAPLVLAVIQVVTAQDHLVLGRDAVVEVRIEAASAQAVHARASVGSIEDPRAVSGSPGRFVSTYHAPAEAYPQVAVIAIWTDGGDAGMAVVPLWGAATLLIQADTADAAITMTIAGRDFKGRSDATGRAMIAFTAPPGARTGAVQATDQLGNVTHKEVPLGIPDAPRVLVVAPPEAAADGTPVRILAFGATPDGHPDPSLSVTGATRPHALAPGVVAAELPPRTELGEVPITATASGQTASARVRFVPGPPRLLEAAAVPADGGAWTITARVVDGASHPVALPPTAHTRSGDIGAFLPSGDGRFVARFQPSRPSDPGEVTVRAGDLERRLVLEARGPHRPRWTVRGEFASNLARVAAGGALVGLELPLGSRLFALAEAGVLVSSGQVDQSDFSFTAVPLRVGLGVALTEPGRWQPYVAAHAGVMIVSAQAHTMAIPERSQGEAALDLGGELGLRRRLGPGSLAIAAGASYTPVVSGDLVQGTLATLSAMLGYRWP